jgi:hypothetical protein
VTEKGATDIGIVAVGGLYHVGGVRDAEVEEVARTGGEYRGLVAVVLGLSGDVTPVAGRGTGEVNGAEGAGGELGLAEGCPACGASEEGLGWMEESGMGVGDITPLATGGEFGAVNEKGLGSWESVDVDSIGIFGLLCERGFVIEDGMGGDDGGVLGLLWAKVLKASGADIESGEMRGELKGLWRGLV